mmetsp:Transcript_51988/g.130608  ORF Transcript_51988/g.130608 Transcript_51988/m.130608 type:complete len:104 (-) Transcript_51988:197-508(-)
MAEERGTSRPPAIQYCYLFRFMYVQMADTGRRGAHLSMCPPARPLHDGSKTFIGGEMMRHSFLGPPCTFLLVTFVGADEWGRYSFVWVFVLVFVVLCFAAAHD